ncbi:uncharacterized protein LOC121871167 [Homarus americanus]|uniref:uncharacterized protein LOC121871167 n=1 Tax=Homarus americanus TaxID=6706 RepID=UPI001C48F4DB|nr:uncharacterized protein LOC121871167 [Homarus americanus]
MAGNYSLSSCGMFHGCLRGEFWHPLLPTSADFVDGGGWKMNRPPPPPVRNNMRPTDIPCFEGKNQTCWLPVAAPGPRLPLPNGPHTLYRSLEDYKPFTNISRTIHFSEYEDITKEGLKPTNIQPKHLTYLCTQQSNVYGLFFGIIDDDEVHDWYGNVRLQVDFKKFMKEVRPRVYFVDVVDFKTSNISRLLLTKRNYDHYFPRYDANILGGPWFRDPSGKDWHLTNARRFNSVAKSHHEHSVEFILELSKEEFQRLYSSCKKLPVDHSRAITNEAKVCLKYKSVGKVCPSPWNAEKTEEKMMCLSLKKISFQNSCDRIVDIEKNRD